MNTKGKEELAFEDLHQALPQVRTWVENYVQEHKADRIPIADFGFSRLPGLFEPNWLSKSYCVIVDCLETPPLAEYGLGDLDFFECSDYGAITYGSTYFIAAGQEKNESLHFHELIHTLQWDQLGYGKFLKVYGVGLLEQGYRSSPLEVIAYDLQAQFDANQDMGNIPKKVRSHARAQAQRLNTLAFA